MVPAPSVDIPVRVDPFCCPRLDLATAPRAYKQADVPVIYCSGNLALNALNCLWFSKMFAKMLARLKGDEAPKSATSETSSKSGAHKRRTSASTKNNASQAAAATGKALSETAPLLEKDGETDGVSEEDEGIRMPVQPPRPVANGEKAEL